MLNQKKNIALEYEFGDYYINEEELRDSVIEILNKQGWTAEELVDNFFDILKKPLLDDFVVEVKDTFYNDAMEELANTEEVMGGERDALSYYDRNKKY